MFVCSDRTVPIELHVFVCSHHGLRLVVSPGHLVDEPQREGRDLGVDARLSWQAAATTERRDAGLDPSPAHVAHERPARVALQQRDTAQGGFHVVQSQQTN